MPSLAYALLVQRFIEVGRIQRSSRILPTGFALDPNLEKSVNRAAVVLLCSHLEGYIEDIITEAIDQLNLSAIAVSILPDEMRQIQCSEELTVLSRATDATKRKKHLEYLFRRHYSFWAPGAVLAPGVLRAQPIIGEFGNPGSKEIISVFSVLGIRNIFGAIAPMTPRSDKARIDAMVGKRNEIAHGGFSSASTRQDVNRYLVNTSWFCKAVDRFLRLHIQQLTGTAPW